MENFGDRLKSVRMSRELSEKELAQAADIRAAAVRRIERRGIRPTLQTVKNLAAALNVPVSVLLNNGAVAI